MQQINPSLSCHIFFSSTQHQTGYYEHHQLYQTHHKSDDNYDYQGGSTYGIKNKVDSGVKLANEDHGHKSLAQNNNPIKWMSSKMKTDTPDRRITSTSMVEDQTVQHSYSLKTDTSSNNSSFNHNSPIRVCADCSTTKTPLWRSGPKGPKSLCNACGIRQRKARRAMAAAAAAANGTAIATADPAVKIKVQYKERTWKNRPQHKKLFKTTVAATGAVGSPSNGQKKIDFEDFLINISNKLAFHSVFPEDEKDAAILLMALSSGLVNG